MRRYLARRQLGTRPRRQSQTICDRHQREQLRKLLISKIGCPTRGFAYPLALSGHGRRQWHCWLLLRGLSYCQTERAFVLCDLHMVIVCAESPISTARGCTFVRPGRKSQSSMRIERASVSSGSRWIKDRKGSAQFSLRFFMRTMRSALSVGRIISFESAQETMIWH